MKNKMDRYRKYKEATEPKDVTSIYIEKKQLKFLKEKNFNLSLLIRDFLNRLMKDESENDL